MIELNGVPALTLQRPWAHAVTHLNKRVENRAWCPPDDLGLLLIHAGKATDPNGFTALREMGHDWATLNTAAEAPHGAIIAITEVVHTCAASRRTTQVVCDCGPWAVAGQHHWHLGQVTVLPNPVPCAGRQRIWYPPADVATRVAVQLVGCELCHEELAVETREGGRLCTRCARYVDYYANLTLTEWRAEHESVARYVDETANQC